MAAASHINDAAPALLREDREGFRTDVAEITSRHVNQASHEGAFWKPACRR
jgi:hypothetical protein